MIHVSGRLWSLRCREPVRQGALLFVDPVTQLATAIEKPDLPRARATEDFRQVGKDLYEGEVVFFTPDQAAIAKP
jgi:hypothetical protein